MGSSNGERNGFLDKPFALGLAGQVAEPEANDEARDLNEDIYRNTISMIMNNAMPLRVNLDTDLIIDEVAYDQLEVRIEQGEVRIVARPKPDIKSGAVPLVLNGIDFSESRGFVRQQDSGLTGIVTPLNQALQRNTHARVALTTNGYKESAYETVDDIEHKIAGQKLNCELFAYIKGHCLFLRYTTKAEPFRVVTMVFGINKESGAVLFPAEGGYEEVVQKTFNAIESTRASRFDQVAEAGNAEMVVYPLELHVQTAE